MCKLNELVLIKYNIVTIYDKLAKYTMDKHVIYMDSKNKGNNFELFFDDNDDLI